MAREWNEIGIGSD